MRGPADRIWTTVAAGPGVWPAQAPGRRSFTWAPRGVRRLLLVIGLYILFPLGNLPLVDISLSAPLFALLLLEMTRKRVRWGRRQHRALTARAGTLAAILLLSWGVNVVRSAQRVTGFDLGLGLRLPYWVLCMVLVSLVVGCTPDPRIYIRAMGWGIIAVGLLRLGSAVFAGMWKVGRALALSQNTYGLLFSTFWPFAVVLVLGEKRHPWTARAGGIILLMAVMVNASRGSWVTVLFTTSLLAATLVRGLPGVVGIFRRLLILGIVVLIAAAGVFAILPKPNRVTYIERTRSFENLDQDASYQTRVAMRRKAVALFKENPILGVGPGRFRRISTEFDLPDRLRGKSIDNLNRKNSHSAYYQFLAETGLLGSVGFIALVSWLLIAGARTAFGLVRRGLLWPMGLFLGFIGMSLHLIVIAGLLGTLPWFMYGLVAGMVVWEQRMSGRRIGDRRARRPVER